MLCNSDFSERLGGACPKSTTSVSSTPARIAQKADCTLRSGLFGQPGGGMGVRDFGLERGRSPLWISNHPRYHGSAWKVPALDIEPSTISRFSVEGPARNIEPSTISWFSVEGPARNIEPSTISRFSVEGPARNIEPSTISWFSVEGPRSGYRTFHDFMVQRGRSPLWISNHPRYHGSAWKVPARKPSQSGRSEPTAELAQPALSSRMAYIPAALTPDLPSTHLVTQYPPIQDMRLKSKCLFIARYGYACRITIS